MIQDMRGVSIEIGDRVVFGKSNRDNPISLGVVVDIKEDEIFIDADGGYRTSRLPLWGNTKQERILVLPDSYKESL